MSNIFCPNCNSNFNNEYKHSCVDSNRICKLNEKYLNLKSQNSELILKQKSNILKFKDIRDEFSKSYQDVINNLTNIIEHISNNPSNKSNQEEDESPASAKFKLWDIRLDPLKKHQHLELSDGDKTVTHINPSGHATVLGYEGFSSGRVEWKIRVNKYGDTNWICIGVLPLKETFGDYQNGGGFNLRGGDYPCESMAPDRIPAIENGDILICTLDFDLDYFEIACESGKFDVKSTKSIQGMTLYPFIELYYNEQSVTIID